MSDLIPRVFDYRGRQIRTALIEGEPWFIASDVCGVLEIDTSLAVNGRWRTNADGTSERDGGLDEDEKGTAIVSTPGGPQEVLIVNEPGLYALILKSRKPEAKAFKRWITHEVIPSIRKTGSYVAKPMTEIQILQQAVALLARQEERLAAVESSARTLNHRIDSLDTANIEGSLRQRLEKMVKRYAWASGIYHSVAWHRFDSAYNTAFHANLTALRQNFCRQHGLRDITRPEYLEQVGRLEDAIRVADKMLNTVRASGE